MRLYEIKDNDDELSEAVWWLTRWVSGSMDDEDWDDSWTTFGIDRAFEILHNEVGNASCLNKPLWRYLRVKGGRRNNMPSRAQKLIQKQILPVSPTSVFQSFTDHKDIVIKISNDLQYDCTNGIIVSIIPDPSLIMFGINDLKHSKNSIIQSALLEIGDWHYQNEVIVRVSSPLPLLSIEDIKH